MLIKAAINGVRTVAEHPAIPLTPAQQASESAAAIKAGAGAIHVHVRDRAGNESLAPDDVAQCLDAIRQRCPQVPIGVSTGAWIVPNVHQRQSLVEAWNVLPDFASVNLHEEGALELIALLLNKGVGVEAGLCNEAAARTLMKSGVANHCLRVLLEPIDEMADPQNTVEKIEKVLGQNSRPRLLHGFDQSAWNMVALAARRGYDTRVGLEDTLLLPDGRQAQNNAELITAAVAIVGKNLAEVG